MLSSIGTVPESTSAFGTLSESGLANAVQTYQPWIIVGTVGGFILGVVIAIVVMLLFGRMKKRRNKTGLLGPREITNEHGKPATPLFTHSRNFMQTFF